MLEAPEMRTEQCDSGVDLQKKKKKRQVPQGKEN